MVSDISLNMGYNNNAYMILPLKRLSDVGLTVKSSVKVEEPPQSVINNLDDLKAADKDKNNILSLNELRAFENRTEFAQSVLELMEKFALNFAYKNI